MLDKRITETFVEIADTLVEDFDIIDFLHTLAERCVELLDVDAAGILLVDQRGTLNLVAASSTQARVLELFQLQDEEGPCLDCYRTGQVVASADLGTEPRQWPRFTEAARESGYVAVHAVPMRLRERILGAMNLFSAKPGPISADAAAVAQSFADVATISILNMRALEHSELLAEQLQNALNSRIVIEQAKGVLAERRGVTVADAFDLMRAYSRSKNQRLSEVARGVINRDPALAELTRGGA